MRAFVTGATGFLGQHVVLRLLAQGDDVRILARDTAKAKRLVDRGAEAVVGDVGDPEILRKALHGVTAVYHLAGKLFAPGVPDRTYHRTHVESTRILLGLCAKQPNLTRFVHCSTTGVLGFTGDEPAGETAPYRPTNAYEQTKSEAELLVRDAGAKGVPVVTVRPGLVYGPHDLHLLGLFRAIERGLFRPIGRRPVSLHPIYVDDMTEAFVRCARDVRAIGECFHIAGAEPATVGELAATIADALGVRRPAGALPLPLARLAAALGDALPAGIRGRAPLTRSRLDFLTHSRIYDVGKAGATLDFTPATDLPAGISRTVAWYRRAGHLATPPHRTTPQRARHETPSP
jgi:nucleoside-diphosphate-sugar epimerase